MKITSLLENTSIRPDIRAEHGLSLFIETESRNILFDMGQTDAFAENATVLGIDLNKVDLAILSHGHYDHGGGLRKFLEINKTAPIYVNRYAFEPHYNASETYIGLDPSLQDHPRLIFTDGTSEIAPNCTLYTDIRKTEMFDLGNFGLTVMEQGILRPDDFRHEQYLLIQERSKRILFSGCSHRGIANIVAQFRPDILIGGFHVSKMPLEQPLRDYTELLAQYGTTFYTCHCTGTEQFAYMQQSLPHLHYLAAGQSVSV